VTGRRTESIVTIQEKKMRMWGKREDNLKKKKLRGSILVEVGVGKYREQMEGIGTGEQGWKKIGKKANSLKGE
jgi:hypothetical protein